MVKLAKISGYMVHSYINSTCTLNIHVVETIMLKATTSCHVNLTLFPAQMYCNASGYKKRKTDTDLEDELTAKDMSGFEVDFV